MKSFLLILIFLLSITAHAQDSLRRDTPRRVTHPVQRVVATHRSDSLKKDSLVTDSLRRDSVAQVFIPYKDSIKPILKHPFSDSIRFLNHRFFSFTNPVRYTITQREWHGKEGIFYSVIVLLIFFALIKNNFRRYFGDLFRSYFRTSLRQKQIKEQLLQSPIPSILFNVFFILSTAMFLTLIFQHFQIADQFNFWLLLFYTATALAIVYTGKFLALKILGWIFQASEATNTYIFIVFATNKIIGITVLPFLVVLAFTYGVVYQIAFTLSLIIILGLLLYRYFLSYISIHSAIRINFFHFLLYFAAFEVLPLLLINKLLLIFIAKYY